jgi:hypothetical protein
MKRTGGWFQIGLGLILFLSLAIGLSGCMKCGLKQNGSCDSKPYCTCP